MKKVDGDKCKRKGRKLKKRNEKKVNKCERKGRKNVEEKKVKS